MSTAVMEIVIITPAPEMKYQIGFVILFFLDLINNYTAFTV